MNTINGHSFDNSLFSTNPKIIDLGACVGDFSNQFVAAYPSCKIILIEANKNSFQNIQKLEQFEVINAAIGLTDGDIIEFFEDRNIKENCSSVFRYFTDSLIKHSISTISIKNIIKMFNLKKGESIDLMKVDVEGSEYEILLKTDEEDLLKIKQISVEFHDFIDKSLESKNKEVIDRLASIGFSMVYNTGMDYKLGTKYVDTLFIREK
jgi:FkbM family methyltransferase